MKNPFRWPTGYTATLVVGCLASKASTPVTIWCALGLAFSAALDLRRAYVSRVKPEDHS